MKWHLIVRNVKEITYEEGFVFQKFMANFEVYFYAITETTYFNSFLFLRGSTTVLNN